MIKYTITDLEKITGIKAHTLRIWEKRYQIITPNRTPSNARYYLDEDVKKILNISTLKKFGLKISEIIKMDSREINKKVLELSSSISNYDSQINNLFVSMIEFHRDNFEKIVSNSILKIGFEDTFIKILFPLLDKIGILWQVGSIIPAQEHFISNLIRQKLIIAIDAQNDAPKSNAKTFLLFLPSDEWHELGLLFYYYLLKKDGHEVLYLGQSTPFEDLIKTQTIKNADFIFTHLVTRTVPYKACEYIKNLSQTFPSKTIFISGKRACEEVIDIPENIIIVKDMMKFKEILHHYI